jgi:hypothetical protein
VASFPNSASRCPAWRPVPSRWSDSTCIRAASPLTPSVLCAGIDNLLMLAFPIKPGKCLVNNNDRAKRYFLEAIYSAHFLLHAWWWVRTTTGAASLRKEISSSPPKVCAGIEWRCLFYIAQRRRSHFDRIFCRLHVTQSDFLVLAKRFREVRIAA